MEAAASYSRPLFLPPHFSSSSRCVRLQKILPERCSTNCLSGNGSFAFAFPRQLLRPGKGISSSSSMKQKHERNAINSSQEEEIIALFRRIQIAISETETGGSTNAASSQKERSTENSVSAKAKNKQGKKKGKQGVVEKQVSQNSSQGKAEEFKLSRPATNFVRRSQEPSPSAPRGMDNELEDGKSIAMNNEKPAGNKLEQMKLPQLKELAKSKGIKGYSKLKKQELVELLRHGTS